MKENHKASTIILIGISFGFVCMVCREATLAKQRQAQQQLQQLATEAAKREREALWLRVRDDSIRIGSLSVMHAGPIGALLLGKPSNLSLFD